MPVLAKNIHEKLMLEFINRYQNLRFQFDSRELNSAREGTKGRGSWTKPEKYCATIGSSMELSMAVEDFKTILAEIKKLK